MKSNKQIYETINGECTDSYDYLFRQMLAKEIEVKEFYEQEYKLISNTLDKLVAFNQLLQLQYQLDAIEFEYYIKMFDRVSERIEQLEKLQNDFRLSLITM